MSNLKYIGCNEDQINWGSNDDPRPILKTGNIYEVENKEVHSWHTKIKLKNINGQFNSVCFEEADNE